jgi:hypothetical protein
VQDGEVDRRGTAVRDAEQVRTLDVELVEELVQVVRSSVRLGHRGRSAEALRVVANHPVAFGEGHPLRIELATVPHRGVDQDQRLAAAD